MILGLSALVSAFHIVASYLRHVRSPLSFPHAFTLCFPTCLSSSFPVRNLPRPQAMKIASEICVYTNDRFVIETMTNAKQQEVPADQQSTPSTGSSSGSATANELTSSK